MLGGERELLQRDLRVDVDLFGEADDLGVWFGLGWFGSSLGVGGLRGSLFAVGRCAPVVYICVLQHGALSVSLFCVGVMSVFCTRALHRAFPRDGEWRY